MAGPDRARSNSAILSAEGTALTALATLATVGTILTGSTGRTLFAFQLRQESLSGQVVTALFVNAHELNGQLVAFLHYVFNLFYETVGQILDMAHTFLAGSKLNECADGDDTGNLTGISCAYLGLEADCFDLTLCCLSRSGVAPALAKYAACSAKSPCNANMAVFIRCPALP